MNELYIFKTFSDRLIPCVLDALYKEFDNLMDQAYAITLIPDEWTQAFVSREYLGLVAMLINEHFEKELIVIGLKELPRGHSAEEIRDAILDIVNTRFKSFNKNKIQGNN